MPLVSVIVPIYNAEKYLEQCVDSILSQTYRSMEILLIDDGSTDGCFTICKKYAEEDARIRVVHKPNGGLVGARKTGVKEAVGDYVIWVDADDWIEPDYIEELVKAQKRTQVKMVAADLYFDIDNSSKVIRNGFSYGVYDVRELYHSLLYSGRFYEYGINPHLVTKLIYREILQQKQMAVDERIVAGEDAAVTYPCLLAVDKICITNVCGYHYVQRPGSMTKTESAGEEQRIQVLFSYLEKSFERAGLRDIFRSQLNQYKKYFMMLRKIELLDNPKSDEVLQPYGGIRMGSKVVLYGAGGLGQSIFRYLTVDKGVEIVAWLDRSYTTYRTNSMSVDAPEHILTLGDSYDYVIIANTSGEIAEAIKQDLIQMDVKPGRIKWLSEKFLREDGELEELTGA